MPEKVSVLFVCLGNICRSTMAEGIFRHLASQAQYKDKIDKIDSCGTGAYHVGDPPDERTLATLESYGITGFHHRARRFRASDFEDFDYIFAMDKSNLSDVLRLQQTRQTCKAKVMLYGEFGGSGKDEIVRDPYYGGIHGFEKAHEQCSRFGRNFLQDVFGDVDETP